MLNKMDNSRSFPSSSEIHFCLELKQMASVARRQIISNVLISDLNLSQDVAGATFMAVATSTPELFINIIGTFITQSDLGVGTVVGSALFNTLGVVSCIGLAACKVNHLKYPNL
jgi:Ca2+/Na+ antiporter